MHFEYRPCFFVEFRQVGKTILRIGAHAAEFVHAEFPAVSRSAFLLENDRTLRIVDFDGDGNDKEEPREPDDDKQTERDIEKPLNETIRIASPQPLGSLVNLFVLFF